jgi:hypothetical protein
MLVAVMVIGSALGVGDGISGEISNEAVVVPVCAGRVFGGAGATRLHAETRIRKASAVNFPRDAISFKGPLLAELRIFQPPIHRYENFSVNADRLYKYNPAHGTNWDFVPQDFSNLPLGSNGSFHKKIPRKRLIHPELKLRAFNRAG